MGILTDNLKAICVDKNYRITPVTGGVVAALTSRAEDDREVIIDASATMIANLLTLYKQTIFPSVRDDIKFVKDFVEKKFAEEITPKVVILEKNIAPVFIDAYDRNELVFNNLTDVSNRVMFALDYQISGQNSKYSAYLSTVPHGELKQVWAVISKIVTGERSYGYLYSIPVANAMQIALAIVDNLDVNEPLAGTMGTAADYRDTVTSLIGRLSTMVNSDIEQFSNMTDKGTVVYRKIKEHGVTYIMTIASNLLSFYKSGGTIEAIYGENNPVTIEELKQRIDINEKNWDKQLAKASMLRRTATYKTYIAAYDALMNTWTNTGKVIINRGAVRSSYVSLSDIDISNVKKVVASFYGDYLYPESGFNRFSEYMEQYQRDTKADISTLAAYASIEMVADYLISEVIISK